MIDATVNSGYAAPMSKAYTRLDPTERKEQILAAAVRLALATSCRDLTRDAVAFEAGVSCGLVNTYFPRVAELREEVMRVAVRERHVGIVAQGLAEGSEIARSAPAALRSEAAQTLAV